MITPTVFSNTQSIVQEKARLRQAIAQQEQVVLNCINQAKQETSQAISPVNLIKNGASALFSIATLRKNPVASFQLGYKLVRCLTKCLSRKK